MSHNYPNRRPLSDTELRSDPGPYSSADRHHHPSADRNFYRPPQESISSSYPSASSSRGSAARLPAQRSQDGAHSILSSCGLEPDDLALLAEMPEDVLTIESLPHILKQIKGTRGAARPFSPSAPSPPSSSSSSHRAAVSSTSRDWDHHRNQPVQYPLDLIPPTTLPSEQLLDHWGNPRTSSVRADPPSSSSSSSGYMMDFHCRPSASQYGKTGPVPSKDRPRARSSRFSEAGPDDFRSVPPSKEHYSKPRGGRREPGSSSIRSSRSSASMPSKKQATDFHGTPPSIFPYSCSLCDITVLSEKVWTQHTKSTQHADGQLNLLQQFPNWDCRMETASRDDSQSETTKDEEKPASQNQIAPQQNKKKTSDKGKVVCVKFPAQSVDETYLKKLAEPFGNIVKILMFPSLAFVELSSVDQAKDLVKFHISCPPTVNGEQIEFSISNAFNFQSSPVVSFTPAPAGEDGPSDLISIVKRFGSPLYTLFLPSTAFVEMKVATDAQKLVDYYSSNTLRINDDSIKVAFSAEYKSLMRVPSAKSYEEDPGSTKSATSSSQEKDETTETKRTRSGSKDSSTDRKTRSRSRDKPSKERESRTRSRSRDKSSKERESRSRDKSSKEKKSRTRSRDKSSKERKSRSRSRDKSSKERKSRTRSRDKSSKERKSRSRDKSSKERKSRTRSRDKSRKERKSRTRSRSKSSKERKSRTRSKSRKERKSRTRSRSKSSKERKSRTRSKSSKERKSRTRSRDKSSKERKSRTRSRDKSSKERKSRTRSRDKSSKERKSRTRSRDKSSKERMSKTRSRSRDKSSKERMSKTRSRDKSSKEGTSKTRSRSREKSSKERTSKTRSKSKDKSSKERTSKTRSRSRDKSSKERKSRSKSRDKSSKERKSRTRSRDKSSKERKSRTRSRDKSSTERTSKTRSRDKSSKERKSRSKSRDKSGKTSSRATRTSSRSSGKKTSRENSAEPEKPDADTGCNDDLAPLRDSKPEAADGEQVDDGAHSAAEESDLEGMEVIAEDGENLEDEDVENEGEEEERMEEETDCQEKPVMEEAEEKKEAEEMERKEGDEEICVMKQHEDEEDEDFPVDLENCITLDELEEEQSDDPGEDDADEPEDPTFSRVLYFSNLPLRFYTDAAFLKLVKGFGTVSRYLLIRSRREGFIEMSASSEAVKAAKQLTCRNATLNNCKLNIHVSHKYTRLTNGWTVKSDHGKERRSEWTSRSSRKRERRSKSRTSDRDDTDRRSKGRKESSRTTSEKSSVKKQDRESVKKKAASRKSSSEDEDSAADKTSQKESLKRRRTPENGSVPRKTQKKTTTTTAEDPEKEKSETPEEKRAAEDDLLDKKPSATRERRDEEEKDPATSAGRPEQDSEAERPSGPTEGAAEPEKPTGPVGTEFVRPVVGYFCHLCQLIFIDEDEAKQQHCSSTAHYSRYQEKTGKDPWTS